MTHGDDLVLAADGSDTYGQFKEAGRFKIFKRTEGVSTTDIVGRLLSLSKEGMKTFKNIQSPMNTDMLFKNISEEEVKGNLNAEEASMDS
jgi:ethanolamine-phosphate cytidylyltransferase